MCAQFILIDGGGVSQNFYQPQGWSTCAAGPGEGGKGTFFSFLETSVHVKPLENL